MIVTGRDAGRLAAIGSETTATTSELEARDSAAVDAAARRGLLNHEAIAAAKAGVEGLALAAASYARYQVWVNCVAPG